MEFHSFPKIEKKLFNRNAELLPSVTEFFELELAYLEYYSLDKSLFYDRLAYFKSIDGKNTKHYDMLSKLEEDVLKNRSIITANYFKSALFTTG